MARGINVENEPYEKASRRGQPGLYVLGLSKLWMINS